MAQCKFKSLGCLPICDRFEKCAEDVGEIWHESWLDSCHFFCAETGRFLRYPLCVICDIRATQNKRSKCVFILRSPLCVNSYLRSTQKFGNTQKIGTQQSYFLRRPLCANNYLRSTQKKPASHLFLLRGPLCVVCYVKGTQNPLAHHLVGVDYFASSAI